MIYQSWCRIIAKNINKTQNDVAETRKKKEKKKDKDLIWSFFKPKTEDLNDIEQDQNPY